MSMAELCRQHRMSTASFYKWRAKYNGMQAAEPKSD
ncbi:transposase (plasmid) [Loktanella salsilacus]|nr:transposase [Loktanella salsilacus]